MPKNKGKVRRCTSQLELHEISTRTSAPLSGQVIPIISGADGLPFYREVKIDVVERTKTTMRSAS